MRAKQEGILVTFELEGHLDFETTVQFHNTCKNVINAHENVRLVFNMEKLKFVGSSGINQFVKVMKNLNGTKPRPKLLKVSSEFEKIFRALETARNPFELHETVETAILAFDAPEAPEKKRAVKKKKKLDV